MIWAVVPAMIVLNHLRGGGGLFRVSWLLAYLPGRVLYWIAPLVGLLAWTCLPWPKAIAFGLAYLIWGVAEWGRWFSLGRLPRDAGGRPVSWFARGIEMIAGTNDYAAFTIRNFVMLIPAFYFFPFLLALAPLQTGAYEIGWRISPKGGIGVGELLTGALWGVVLVLS